MFFSFQRGINLSKIGTEGHTRHTRNLGQGWSSGGDSTRPPQMWPGFDSLTRRHTWIEFVGSLLYPGRFSTPLLRFSPLTQNQHLIWFDLLWFRSDLWSTQLVKQEFSAKSKGTLLLLVWWRPPSSSHRPLYHDYQHTWASSKESDLLWSGLGCGISFFSSSSTTVSCASTKLSNLLKSAKFSCFWSLTLSVSTASLLLEVSSSFSGEQGSTLAGSTLSPI